MVSTDAIAMSQRDWLLQLILARPASDAVSSAAGSKLARVRAAREYLAHQLTDLGIVYGTPLPAAPLDPTRPGTERLYLAVMSGLVRLGIDLAQMLGRDPAQRAADLAVPLLALAGETGRAVALSESPRTEKAVHAELRRAGRLLAVRAESLTSDPASGVPLHNGVTFSEAWTFGRIAIAYFSAGSVHKSRLERRLQQAGEEKADLVRALVQLVWSDHPPTPTERRTIARQIAALGMSWRQTRSLRGELERPSGLQALARAIHGRVQRRFIMAQAILASLIDGRRSSRELAFLSDLAKALELPPHQVSALELELAEFYAQHRDFVDTFTAANAGVQLADELIEDIASTLERNLDAVVREFRSAGELAELVAKAARGGTLTADERQRMRAELVDMAKTIPSLALVAAPGGLLILAALAKVLPFSILPSAFDSPPTAKPDKARRSSAPADPPR